MNLPVSQPHIGAVDRDSQLAQLSKLARHDRMRLFRFVHRRVGDPVEAEEIAQQAFVEAIGALERFRGEAEMRTWLYGIASKLISNYVRRAPARRYRFESDAALMLQPAQTCDPSELAAYHSLLGRVSGLLDQLPAEMRETLLMVLLDDVSYADAAQQLGIPVGTVRSRISRARAMLREGLAAEGAGDPCR